MASPFPRRGEDVPRHTMGKMLPSAPSRAGAGRVSPGRWGHLGPRQRGVSRTRSEGFPRSQLGRDTFTDR